MSDLPPGWAWSPPAAIPADHAVDYWSWHAWYADGSGLQELGPGEARHAFREIALDRLAQLVLEPLRPGLPRLAVPLGGGRRPIFYRLRTLTSDPAQLSPDPTLAARGFAQVLHVLGYQEPLALPDGTTRSVKHFSYLYPDGTILASPVPLFGDRAPGEDA